MDEELLELLKSIKEKREKDGYIVECKTNNKYTLEEVISKIIKSHT